MPSWIKPPMTATSPLATLITDSSSRVWIWGIGLMIGGMLHVKEPVMLVLLGVPQGFARLGLGSFTKLSTFEIVGFTFSSTTLLSLICGVTFMTKPTATELGVVVNVVSVCVWDCVACEVIVK